MNAGPAGSGVAVPKCVCHDEPMLFNGDRRYRAGGFWYCRIKHRRRGAVRYATNFKYRAEQGMRTRRNKALVRRRERQLRRAES